MNTWANLNAGAGTGSSGPVKIADGGFYAEYSGLDRAYAKEYLDRTADEGGVIPAGCSGAISPDGNLHGRNLDYYYDDTVSVVAKTPRETVDGKVRHATLGVCITKVNEKRLTGEPESDEVKIIPFRIDDGINDAGLTIQVNVIPWKDGTDVPAGRGKGTVPDLMAVRCALDDFDDAKDAAEWITANVYYTKKSFRYHWLVSDAKGQVWLAEDWTAVDLKAENRPFMTNFRTVLNPVRDGSVDWDAVAAADPHGMGVERYETILDAYGPGLNTLDGMAGLMGDKLRYTNAYRLPEEIPAGQRRWDTEACQVYELSDYPQLSCPAGSVDYDIAKAKENPDVADCAPELSAFAGTGIADFIYGMTRDLYVYRDYVRGSWWTTWTSIYDRAAKELHVRFREKGGWLRFGL